MASAVGQPVALKAEMVDGWGTRAYRYRVSNKTTTAADVADSAGGHH